MTTSRFFAAVAVLAAVSLPLQAQTLDPAWGSGGQRSVWFDLPTLKWDEATDAVVQPDGKLVIVGYARRASSHTTGDVTDFTVARLLTNGMPDTTFAGTGKLHANFSTGGRLGDVANAVALDASGRIYVAGRIETPQYCGMVVRYSAAGVLDTSYGTGGMAKFCDATGSSVTFLDLAIDAQGRAVIASDLWNIAGPHTDGLVVRFTANGALDTSFTGGSDSGNGIGYRTLFLVPGAYHDTVRRIAVLPSGEMLVAGSTRVTGNDSDFMVYKLAASNGALVTSFGSAGKARLYLDSTAPGKTSDFYDEFADFVVLPDGRMRLLGNCRWAITGTVRPCIIAATAAGGYDSAFMGNGKVGVRSFVMNIEVNNQTSSEARAIALRADGTMLVVGSVFDQSPIRMSMAIHWDAGSGNTIAHTYSAFASWANAVVFAQNQAVLVGATSLDTAASDVDQATARFNIP